MPNKAQERRYSSTADEEEDHTCINMFIGALCLEFTGWGSWQVWLSSHGPAVSRSKGWQERGAGER